MRHLAQKLTTTCAQAVCLLLVLATHSHAAENTGKILKWKDEKGTTHYGDRVPPQYANRESTVINQQGITVKRNKPNTEQDASAEMAIAKQDQDKKDKALLGAFTHENEIDLARDRNLQLDLVSLENLQQEKNNVQKRLAENKKSADGFNKQKKKIPADLSAEMASNQVTNARLEQLISERKQVIENTRQRFEQDKQRYISLKNRTAENSSPPEAGTVNSPEKTTAGSMSSGSR